MGCFRLEVSVANIRDERREFVFKHSNIINCGNHFYNSDTLFIPSYFEKIGMPVLSIVFKRLSGLITAVKDPIFLFKTIHKNDN